MALQNYTPNSGSATGMARTFPTATEEEFSAHSQVYATAKYVYDPLASEVLGLNADRMTKAGYGQIFDCSSTVNVGDLVCLSGSRNVITANAVTASGIPVFGIAEYKPSSTTVRIVHNSIANNILSGEPGKPCYLGSGTSQYSAVPMGATVPVGMFISNNTALIKADPKDALLAPAMVGKNRIINGAMDIWQRGTSFASIASATYTADRFQYVKAGTGAVHTISRSGDVPFHAGRRFNYSLSVACGTADTSKTAGDLVTLRQVIEGYNSQDFLGNGYNKGFTLSFWIKATKTGIHSVRFASAGADRSYVAEYTVFQADTWEYKVITVKDAPTGGTWDSTNGRGIYIDWCLMAGSTYCAPSNSAGSWQSGDYYGTTRTVNNCDSTSNIFRITGVQLEAGLAATPFEFRHFGTELALCQRYCWVPEGSSRWNAMAFSSQGAAAFLQHPVQMRAAPTATTISNTGFTMWSNTLGASYTTTSAGSHFATKDTTYFTIFYTSASPFTAGNALMWNVITTGNLVLDAEL